MSRIFLIALVFIVVLVTGVGFTALNAVPVHVDYFLGTLDTTLPWVLLFTLLAGFLFGFLVTAVWWIGARRTVHRLRKQLRTLEAEVNNLRHLPIRDAR